MKCIICGREDGVNTIKLPYGSFNVCHSQKCEDLLTYSFSDNLPIATVGKDDLGEDFQDEHLTEKELEDLSKEEFMLIVQEIREKFWSIEGESYAYAVGETVATWLRDKELSLVKDSNIKDLPTLIGHLKYDDSKSLLEKRLKGEHNGNS